MNCMGGRDVLKTILHWSSSCGWASSSDGLDVDGVDFKPASGVIIQDQQTLYSFWWTM